MRPLVLAVFFIISFYAQAENTVKLTKWTKKILINSLSIRSSDIDSDEEQHRIGLAPIAWDSLHNFINGYMSEVKEKQLMVHPSFLIEPRVVDSGTAAGYPFWRLNTEMLLPELNTKIALSLIVISTKATEKDPYLIHSMQIVKQENQ